MSSTATKTKNQGRQKGQTVERLGNGIFTANMLSSWTAISKRLLALGWEQREVDYVNAVAICPLGHEDHLNEAQAAKKFFPKFTGGSAKGRIANRTKEFFTLLFTGQHVEEYLEAHKALKAPEAKGPDRRIRKTPEQKAKLQAEKELKQAFRHDNGIGTVGKLSAEYAPQLKAYLKKNMDNAVKLILDEQEA